MYHTAQKNGSPTPTIQHEPDTQQIHIQTRQSQAGKTLHVQTTQPHHRHLLFCGATESGARSQTASA